MERNYLEGSWQKDRSFSPAVITADTGKVIWLAGHGGFVDDRGRSIAGDFDAQSRQSFANLEATLKEAGGTLADLVTMTVYIIDSRFGDQFVKIRKEYFRDGNYPCSALITCAGFAKTEMMVEIQGIAVIG
ncbi:MAG: RidA family protein [Pseudomonadota bacterium]|nr:RidA family protein [Pseudomonadota bacterium]